MSLRHHTPQRSSFLDAYRGFAVLLMILFHFCWDLKTFGYLEYSLKDPFWVAFRYVILTLFLTAVGWSSYLAVQAGQSTSRYLRNLIQIVLSASVISIGSYFAMPNQWIFFGILHFIVLAAIVVRPLAVRPKLSCTIGVAIIIATYSTPGFEASIIRETFSALGAPTHTLDYISPLPWIGVVLIGPILGYFKAEKIVTPRWPGIKLIGFMGRHALAVYLTHQLILYPLVASTFHILN